MEIIDTKVKDVKTRRGNTAIKDRLAQDDEETDRNPNILGDPGAYGRAEKHKNLPPGMIVKYASLGGEGTDPKKDGYFNYLNELVKNDRMASNPYFPRIYSITKIDNDQMAVVMEKLQPFMSLSNAEVEAMGDRAFGDFDAAIKEHVDRATIDWTLKLGKAAKKYFYVDLVSRAVTGKVPLSAIKDESLQEALMVIRQIMMLRKGNEDIHHNNVMVRRGPTGAQMVLLDPLSRFNEEDR